MTDVLEKQVGGNHYKGLTYQPIEFLQDIHLNTALGYAIKYVSRYPNKNPDDLDKAIHCIELYEDFVRKNNEDGCSQIIWDRDKIFQYTHQFEPNKAIALQKIIRLASNYFDIDFDADELLFSESQFETDIADCLVAIENLRIA